jgi:F-type H+-transporting ATPase subunit delta
MANTRATLRYAKSLFELAKEQNALEACKADMETIISICSASHELSLLLKSPVIKTDKKLSILSEVFTSLSPLSNAFVELITKKKREPLLVQIAQQFMSVYKTSLGIETAIITTAQPLDDQLRAQVLEFIKKQGIQKVELSEKVNENLIGGAIVRIGDRQLDASVLRQINDLKQSFNKNLYIKDF